MKRIFLKMLFLALMIPSFLFGGDSEIEDLGIVSEGSNIEVSNGSIISFGSSPLRYKFKIPDNTNGIVTVKFKSKSIFKAMSDGTTIKAGTSESIEDDIFSANSMTEKNYWFNIFGSDTVQGRFEVQNDNYIYLTIEKGGGFSIMNRDELIITYTSYSSMINDISISNISTIEGNSGTKSVKFTVTTENDSGAFFKYELKNGTAKAGSDYVNMASTATMEKGEYYNIILKVKGDRVVEDDEYFSIKIFNGETSKEANITIENDDKKVTGAVNLSISDDISVVEGDANTTSITFTIDADNSTGAAVFNYKFEDGSAKSGSDYENTIGTMTIQKGEQNVILTLPIVKGDMDIEEDEDFYIELSSNSKDVVFTRNRAKITIINDDDESTYIPQPFTCDTNSYLFGSDKDDDYSNVYSMSFIDKSIDNIKTIAGSHINATGYNVKDDYIYGFEFGNQGSSSSDEKNFIVKIDSNFRKERFKVSGLPEKTYYLGDVSFDGVYYLADRDVTGKNGVLVEIQRVNTEDNMSLMSVLTLTYPKDVDKIISADFAFNPKDKKIYTVNSKNNSLYRIDPDSGDVENLGGVGLTDDIYSVISFFDKHGNFYFYKNSDKKVYRIDISDPTNIDTTAHFFSDISSKMIGSGDGARCPNAEVDKNIEDNNLTFGCQSTALLSKETEDLFELDTINKREIKYPSIFKETSVNAMGYNHTDGYVWGYDQVSMDGTLVKIGKGIKGKAYQSWKFKVDNNSFEELSGSVIVGDIDKQGQMYVLKRDGIEKNLTDEKDYLYVIDLNRSSSNYLKVVNYQEIRDMQRGSPGVGEALNIVDWAFHPKNGKLYGLSNYDVWIDGNILYKIDPISYEVTTTIITGVDTTSQTSYEAFFDENGYFYAYGNESGKTYRIDLTNLEDFSGEAMLFTNVPTDTIEGDTARCSSAPMGDKPIVSLQVRDTIEGDNGISDVNITINSDREIKNDIKITYATTAIDLAEDKIATKDVDFISKTETITIPKGVNNISIPVVKGDENMEKNELFTIRLESDDIQFLSESGVNKGITVNATIVDDDFNTLDAFDTDENISNPIVKTKKVNENFLLKIATIDFENSIKSFDGIEDVLVRIVPPEACVSNVEDIPSPEIGFSLLGEDSDNDGVIEKSFTVAGAIKNAKVQFWWKDSSKNLQTTCSSDSFSVRPDKYILTVPTLVAGKEFDINIIAVDVLGNPVRNYEELSNVYKLDINDTEVLITNPKCKLGTISEISRTPFVNGVSTARLKYSDIGQLQFEVSEIENMNSEYANIDASNDTNSSRFISPNPLTTQHIVASKLVASYSFTTQNNVDAYTYYSKNPSIMGAMIDVNVRVQNEDGNNVINFTDGCYAEDVNISIAYNRTGELIDGIDFNVSDIVLNGGNLKYQLDDNSFTDGNASRRVYMNFGRDTTHVKEPLKIQLTNTKAQLTDVPDDTSNINKTISFIYARAHVQNEITVVGEELNATVDYEVYLPNENGTTFGLGANLVKSKDDLSWSVLPIDDANLTFSSPNSVYLDNDISVVKATDKLITIKTTKTPKKNRVRYKAPSYLIYNDTDPTAVSDSFSYSLQSDTNHWSGKGKIGKIFDDTASREVKRRMEW